MARFPQLAYDLISEERVFGLGGYDGCSCSRFEVFRCRVEVRCHSPSDGPAIYVSSGSMDYDMASLARIGDLVQRQVEEDGGGKYPVILNDQGYGRGES